MSELSALQQQAKKLSKQVNQQILRLERETKTETIAVMNLRNRLDVGFVSGWTKGGRVRFSKKMTDIQLKATIKAIEMFKKEETSTVRGVRRALKNARQTTGQPEFDYKDLFDYTVIEEDLIAWITRYIPPSKFDALVHHAQEHNYSENQFVDMLLKASAELTNDEDTIDKIKRLYNKYVKI